MPDSQLVAYETQLEGACDYCTDLVLCLAGPYWDNAIHALCLMCVETTLEAAVTANHRLWDGTWLEWLAQGEAFAYRAEPVLERVRAEVVFRGKETSVRVCWSCKTAFLARRKEKDPPSQWEMCALCSATLLPNLNALHRGWLAVMLTDHPNFGSHEEDTSWANFDDDGE